MKKIDFVAMISDKTELTRKDTETALNAVFEAIETALLEGEKILIPGFGTFETKETEARVGRNPKTGEPIEIKASTKAVFKPAKNLKDKLNENR